MGKPGASFSPDMAASQRIGIRQPSQEVVYYLFGLPLSDSLLTGYLFLFYKVSACFSGACSQVTAFRAYNYRVDRVFLAINPPQDSFPVYQGRSRLRRAIPPVSPKS